MQYANRNKQSVWQPLAAASIVAVALAVATTHASAGECPAGSKVADGKGQQMGPTQPKDVTDVVRATTDLSKEPAHIDGRQFRLRQLEMKPGGIVPWHSHDNRPAMIYIVSGEVVEYASNCAVPIVHKAGETRKETNGTSHWWKNHTNAQVILFIGDVRRDPDDHHM